MSGRIRFETLEQEKSYPSLFTIVFRCLQKSIQTAKVKEHSKGPLFSIHYGSAVVGVPFVLDRFDCGGNYDGGALEARKGDTQA